MKKAKWWILALCMMVFVSSVPFEAVYASSKVDEGILSEETENEGSNQENDLKMAEQMKSCRIPTMVFLGKRKETQRMIQSLMTGKLLKKMKK